MKVYHGLATETWWKNGLKDCKRILLPYNYIRENKIPDRILIALRLKEWILDSGAAKYFLNNGYPEYPFPISDYFDFIQEWQPSFFVSLDYATEKFKFWHWIDRTIEKNRLIYDLWISKGLKSDFLPVVQGYSKETYQYCFEEIKDIIRSTRRFGIGSICRSPPRKLNLILKYFSNIVDLRKCHLFGQTNRTIPICLNYNIGYIDTANASVHASYKVINDTSGRWLYSNRTTHKLKHNLDHLSYSDFFKINKNNIEKLASGEFGLRRYFS